MRDRWTNCLGRRALLPCTRMAGGRDFVVPRYNQAITSEGAFCLIAEELGEPSMIKRSQLGALLFFGISILWSASTSPAPAVTEPVPIFEVDTSWPTIPNGWTLGNVAK